MPIVNSPSGWGNGGFSAEVGDLGDTSQHLSSNFFPFSSPTCIFLPDWPWPINICSLISRFLGPSSSYATNLSISLIWVSLSTEILSLLQVPVVFHPCWALCYPNSSICGINLHLNRVPFSWSYNVIGLCNLWLEGGVSKRRKGIFVSLVGL